MVFNDIYSLANSFGTTFGLKGNPEPLEKDKLFNNNYILKLEIEEHLKDFISEEDAKEIFDLVTKAFLKGSQFEIERRDVEYRFDRENLSIIEIDHRFDKE